MFTPLTDGLFTTWEVFVVVSKTEITVLPEALTSENVSRAPLVSQSQNCRYR